MFQQFMSRFRPLAPVTMAVNRRQPLYSEQAYSRVLEYFTTVPDPDLMLQKAGIARQHLRLLELDDEVAQCVETRKDAVLNMPWRLEPNQSRANKWLTAQLEPHYEAMIRGLMSAVFYGYSVLELTYRADGGRVTIDRVDERNIEWFRLHPQHGWRYYPDDGSGGVDGLDCDPRKFLIAVRHPTTRNPYGESLLSRLWFPVTWRREGWSLWLKFLETFGQPIVVGRVFDYNAFVGALQAQGVRSVIGYRGSADDQITTIQASQSGEFERLETALTKRIQKLILGQTLTSDVGDVGSYAAATVHNDVRQEKTFSDARLIMRVMQQAVATLARLNGMQVPQFIIADETGLVAERAARDAALLPVLQASGLKLTPNYFEDRYDFRSEDLEAVETPDPDPAMQPGPAAESEPANPGPAEAAEAEASASLVTLKRYTKIQQEIEDLGDAAMEEAPLPIDPVLLRDAILGATSQEDLQERLAVVWDGGPDSAFVETLEKAAFMARVIGYVSAERRES
jgi:phage gp29-like protein